MANEYPVPDEIAKDLLAHGINPSTAIYADKRTRLGNGNREVALAGSRPAVKAVHWTTCWTLKMSGRYVTDQTGEPMEFASAGEALQCALGT